VNLLKKNFSEVMKLRELMILSGGSGTRIREQIPGIPKTLAPIGNKTFIDYLLRYHIKNGIDRFIFCLGQFQEQMIGHLEKNHPELEKVYVCEPLPLGTGGAIKNALPQTRDNTVLVVNGDTYFAIQTGKAAAFHHMCGAECTLILKSMNDVQRYGRVELGNDYRVRGFEEKGNKKQGLINGGAYILNKKMFLENTLPDRFSFEKEYLENRFGSRRIFGVKQDGYFIDIGIPDDLARAQTEIIDYDSRLDQTN
jgi:D-glycero-alpha-D-manno-heptose 1-phosphate guanylyltransferase